MYSVRSVVNRIRRLAAALLIVLAACRPAAPPRVALELVAFGFTSPVALAGPQDGTGRLFVADQVGIIWVIRGGHRLETPFLDLRDRLVKLSDFYDERGLLGLALHPDFARNGKFFVSYSAPVRADAPPGEWDHATYISEFTVSPPGSDQADPASERILLAIDKPGYNYEAGDLAFGADGYLYISTGDSVRDPATEAGQFAQETDSLLGKILRIDVDPKADRTRPYGIPSGNPFAEGGGRPEIFALGFRNPYRFSFDPSRPGRLFVADVGQAVMEEVSLVTAGENYGWPVREGTTCFNRRSWSESLPSCASAGMTDPIIAYRHEGDLSAVIGGSVYRSSRLPALEGGYVYGDWGRGNGHLFVAPRPLGGGRWRSTEIGVAPPPGQAGIGQLLGIEQWGGELYLLVKDPGLGPVGESGKVFRIVSP